MSTHTITWPLPPELTKAVLSELTTGDGRYGSILAAIRVCKEWKSIGRPILWETVVLRKAAQLRSLHTQLIQGTYLHGTHPGKMIRTLYINDLEEDDPDRTMDVGVETIRMVLLMMPCLQRYTLHGWVVQQHDLILLSSGDANSLTYMDIVVQSYSNGVFLVLNSFPRLQTLILELEDDPWEHSTEHPLSNLSLKHVSWISWSMEDAMYRFLARSLLGPNCTLTLSFPEIPSEHVGHLKPLFHRNTFQKLVFSVLSECLDALMPEIMQCSDVVFKACVPSSFTSQSAGTMLLPSTIAIEDISHCADELWNALQGLAAIPRRLDETVSLRVRRFRDPDVDWTDLASDNREFAASLLQLAIPLYKRGIIVLDMHDRDVSTLLSM